MLSKGFQTKRLSHSVRAFGALTDKYTDMNNKYLASTYVTWKPVISKAYGVWMEDVEGKKYLDFHSGYCCTNQGHNHPKILQALKDQADKLVMCSRAFNTDVSGEFSEFISKTFGYDKLIPMNSGTEGCEAAVKLARRWGVRIKGIANDKCEVVFASKCFWGRSIAAISGTDNPFLYNEFGPLCPGFSIVPYNDLGALEKMFKENPNIVGYMLEPIQGEAGIIVPDDGYLKGVQDLCKKYNVLMIADEIQSGLGRSGDLLCHYHEEGVRPDIVVLGKALSGGVIPFSCILADDPIIETIGLGHHGSTYGGYALG
jgi:ornithine--oxo-acid transaminase